MTFRDLVVGNLILTNPTFAYQSSNLILDTQTIWLVGSSIIKHAFLEAVLRPGGTNLTLERKHISLWWQGYSGLQLSKTRQKIRTLEKVGPVPNCILIHCGGNDLGNVSIRKLRVVAKQLVLFLMNHFVKICEKVTDYQAKFV